MKKQNEVAAEDLGMYWNSLSKIEMIQHLWVQHEDLGKVNDYAYDLKQKLVRAEQTIKDLKEKHEIIDLHFAKH